MYDEYPEDFYLDPEQELNFELESLNPMDSYLYTDTLTLSDDAE